MKEYCEFYPKLDGDTCVCDAGSDVGETTDSDDICSKEYSLTCQWANELRTDKSAPFNPTYDNPRDILKRMREYCGEEKYKKFFTEIATKRNGEYLELMTIYEFVATYILNPPALLKKTVEFLKGDER